MMKLKDKILVLGAAVALLSPALVSCSDEPDSENYYTFTGEMMSEYLTSRPQYSDFAAIVERAGRMDLLSTYGHYTCFAPDNDAVTTYLQKRGLSSLDELTDADCDTIARTHLVNNVYSTFDMTGNTLNTPNLMSRYIRTKAALDPDGNAVIMLNKMAYIDFALKDDSVENGIVQPISAVLESSNSTVGDIIRDDSRLGLFYEALHATGIDELISPMKDDDYDPQNYASYPNTQKGNYYYTSDFWKEVARVPDTKDKGFTVFALSDSLLETKYGITTLEQLYDKACEIYDVTYPDDRGLDVHAFTPEALRDSRNPLWRFMAYHILTRNVQGGDYLTPIVLDDNPYKGAIGIKIDKMNPIDWYETLLPHTMIKVEQLTMTKAAYLNGDIRGRHYLNRRCDDKYNVRGALVDEDIDQDGLNGLFFFVDEIVAFSDEVRSIVQNMRIRMDFATVFPELMTNKIRLNGTPQKDDDSGTPDDQDVPRWGRNYWFPPEYLDGVSFDGNCFFVYRRPHWNFWSYEGDEFNLFGDYDFTFRLPPVPYEGEWQVRMGFCALDTRGVAQVYFDGKPQGIPLDMRRRLSSEYFMGSVFNDSLYTDMTAEQKARDQKALKNKGVYRGAYGGYHTSGSSINEFVNNERTYRLVLCQVHIDPSVDHYLRIRCTSSSRLGNNNEFMMDYLELVPRSVYGVTGDNDMEDDL